MKSYFWYQPEKLIDGDKIYRNLEEQIDQFDKDNTYDVIKTTLDKKNNRNDPWCGYIDDMFLLSGSFDAKDEYGRSLSFLYVADNSSVTEIKKNIDAYLIKLGYSLDECTSLCLIKWERHLKNIRIATTLSILLSTICLVLVIYHYLARK